MALSLHCPIPSPSPGCAQLSNISLRVNTLGTHLAIAMLTMPATVGIRMITESKHYSRRILFSLALVVTGVALHSLSDVSLSAGGLLPAVLGVISTAQYQIQQNVLARRYSATSPQLLVLSAPVVAAFALGSALVWEREELAGYSWGWPVALAMLASMVIASTANVAGGAMIAMVSPVAFQVASHVKTMVLFLVAFLFFSPPTADSGPPVQSLVGVACVLVGAWSFSRASR